MIELADIQAARERIRALVEVTPCPIAEPFSDLCGARIYFKLENLQRTGSFKERGAANRLMLLTAAERARGVVAASAGNHAQGVAVNAQRLGIRATIVMPEATPLIKVQSTLSFGAPIAWPSLAPKDAENPRVLDRAYAQVEAAMQSMLDELMDGRCPFLGQRDRNLRASRQS